MFHGRTIARRACLVATIGALVAGMAAPALAATLTSSAGTFNYTAGAGEVNHLTLGFGASLSVADPGTTIASEGECLTAMPGQATCLLPPAEHGTFADCHCEGSVSLGDADDTFVVDPVPDFVFLRVEVDGGPGNDTLTGRRLQGGRGDDVLHGTEMSDSLVGGPGADVMVGRGGDDSVSYGERQRGVRVSLDGRANDGGPGERDDVAVEHVEGGSGPDVIIGNGASNTLTGNLGSDRIRGGGGDDRLSGGEGEDVLDGGPGADDLSSGDEQVLDFRRTLAFDRLRCGGGEDEVHMSPGDVVGADCEHVYFRSESTPNLVVGPARLRLSGGRVPLYVSNNDEGDTRAAGTLRLFAAGRDRSPAGVLGSARMRPLEQGRTVMVGVRLERSARQALARRGRLRLRATLDARAGADARSLTQRIITVTR